MTYILHPSQIQKMPKNMEIQIKNNYVHHVKQIQKMKSTLSPEVCCFYLIVKNVDILKYNAMKEMRQKR
jgi:hypothetical protein